MSPRMVKRRRFYGAIRSRRLTLRMLTQDVFWDGPPLDEPKLFFVPHHLCHPWHNPWHEWHHIGKR